VARSARSDTERNRRRLVAAGAQLAASQGSGVRMGEIAETAGLSLATAYRHFGSPDDVLAQFRFDVGLKLYEFSKQQQATGVDLLDAVSRKWVTLVQRFGAAMVTTRSREGYLARLRAGTGYLTVQADALAEPIRQAAEELGLPDPGDEGLFLWNILFDPREIFDMTSTLGLTADEAGHRLVATFCGALRGWTGSQAVRAEEVPFSRDAG
jgi:AcrR family transcriptional regulator